MRLFATDGARIGPAPARFRPAWVAQAAGGWLHIPGHRIAAVSRPVLGLSHGSNRRWFWLPAGGCGADDPRVVTEALLRVALVRRSSTRTEDHGRRACVDASEGVCAAVHALLAAAGAPSQDGAVASLAARQVSSGAAFTIARRIGAALPGTDRLLAALSAATGSPPPIPLSPDPAAALDLPPRWWSRSRSDLRPAWRAAVLATHPDHHPDADPAEFHAARAGWERVQADLQAVEAQGDADQDAVSAIWGGPRGGWVELEPAPVAHGLPDAIRHADRALGLVSAG